MLIRQVSLERDPIRPDYLDSENLAIGLDQRAATAWPCRQPYGICTPFFSASCSRVLPVEPSLCIICTSTSVDSRMSMCNFASTPRAERSAPSLPKKPDQHGRNAADQLSDKLGSTVSADKFADYRSRLAESASSASF